MHTVTIVLVGVAALLVSAGFAAYVVNSLRVRRTVAALRNEAARLTAAERVDVITVDLSPTEVDLLIERHLDGWWRTDRRVDYIGHVYEENLAGGLGLGFGVHVSSCDIGIATVTVFPYRRGHSPWGRVQDDIARGAAPNLGPVSEADCRIWAEIAEVRHAVRDELLTHLTENIPAPRPPQPPLVSPFGAL